MNKYIYLSGKAKWAKLVTPDLKYGVWNVVLYPDDDSYNKLVELQKPQGDAKGIMNRINRDDDGFFVTLKRPVKIDTRAGRSFNLDPPVVVDGNNLDDEGQPMPLRNALIGNGSDITVKCEVRTYPSGGNTKGTALRIESVRVDNLIPFVTSRDFDQGQGRQTRGLAEQPYPEF